jgi:hypothetical protein
MGGTSQAGRRFLAELPGRRGRVTGDDPRSTMPVTGRDGRQRRGCRVLRLRGVLDHRWLVRPPGPAGHRRRIHRPEAHRPTVDGDAHPRVPALGRRPVLPLVAARRGRAVGPRSGRDMEASFVEWISGGIESVPGEQRALSRQSSPAVGGGVRRRHSHRRVSHPPQEPGRPSPHSSARPVPSPVVGLLTVGSETRPRWNETGASHSG